MSTFPNLHGNARSAVVNRTHRVVREEALKLRANQERTRSLWVPVGIFSMLLPVICYALWAVMDEYDMTPNGVPDASDQLLVLVVWLLPVTALAMVGVWYRRMRSGHEVSR